jgi:hypothetical protein
MALGGRHAGGEAMALGGRHAGGEALALAGRHAGGEVVTQCSVSRGRPFQEDKRIVLEYTHGLFIT